MLASLLAQSTDTTDAAAAGASAVVLIFSSLIGLVLLAFHIYVLVDILKYSDGTWQVSGQNKTTWIVLWVVTFCCGLATILDLVWWFAFRPKLQAAESGPTGGYPTTPG